MLQQLSRINYQIESLEGSFKNKAENIQNLYVKSKDIENELNFVIEVQQFYKKAIDLVYERSIQQLKDVLNSALTTIFHDRQLEMDIILSDKRGKSLQFKITDNGKPVNLKRGMGMGVKCVISAILHIYYLQCKSSKILMLDEAYSNIDEDYAPMFFDFLKELCEKLQLKIILITHDPRFLDYGTKTYTVNMGEVYENKQI